MIVTFCGHKNFCRQDDEEKRLTDLLRATLREHPDAVFYLGDYGQFDLFCNSVLRALQKDFPRMRRVFVTPYLDPEYRHLWEAEGFYDEILYPFHDPVLPRYAIDKRNRWMIERADLVIAHVDHDYGGAAKTVRHALRQKKRCHNLGILPLFP